MKESILKDTTETFRRGNDLDDAQAEQFFDALIAEMDESRLAGLFRAWNRKGIAEDEIFSLAKIMRQRCSKINFASEAFVDIVGTGGSGSKTFNVSTAAAFVVAGGGVPVAKHGNKAATSRSGSADVLTELGVRPAVDARIAERCLRDLGICFMFAPNHHKLSVPLARVRRRLGFPTIFNCIGPLCNPAAAPHGVIGVWERRMVPKMANALARLGTKRSWVVHGKDGLDEITIADSTIVAEVEGGSVRTFEISPTECSLSVGKTGPLRTGSPAESAAVIRSVLAGECRGTGAEAIVVINAMAAFYLTGHVGDLGEGVQVAIESVRSGAADRKLKLLSEATRS